MLEEEAHRRHAAAGARLQRKEDHDELQTPIHCKVRLETGIIGIKIFRFFLTTTYLKSITDTMGNVTVAYACVISVQLIFH